MEEDFYDFEENVLNNMYTYITDRVDYYKKNPFKYRNENWYMIGDLITTSYFKYNSYIVKEYFLDWVHNVKSNFSEDDLSPFIVETFWNIKKVIEKLSDDTIMSWGLNATIIKYAFNKIDDGDSFETAISKLSEEFSKTEDYILNDDTFNIGYLFDSIWPHLMPYLFVNYSNKITDKDDDIIIMESIYFQTGIDLVKKFPKEYYSWSAFYNMSYEDFYNNCDELSIRCLKDIKYQLVHKCFKYYLLYMDDKLGVFKSYHRLVDKNCEYSKYIRQATIDNIKATPLYYAYQGYCKAQNIEPNFTFDFKLLNNGIVCKVHFKNKTNEYYSSLDSKEALELTTWKFTQLYEKLKSSGLIDKSTELDDFLFIFGLKESIKENFHPIAWLNPYSKKPGKELLIWMLKLLGYTEDEIKEGKTKLSTINACFQLKFKHRDFPKTNKVKNPHELGDDKNDLLNLISKLELGDTKWQKTFKNIQYELWKR